MRRRRGSASFAATDAVPRRTEQKDSPPAAKHPTPQTQRRTLLLSPSDEEKKIAPPLRPLLHTEKRTSRHGESTKKWTRWHHRTLNSVMKRTQNR
jgi:hypothetical protein